MMDKRILLIIAVVLVLLGTSSVYAQATPAIIREMTWGETIDNAISSSIKAIEGVFRSVEIIGLNIGFWILVLMFFAILTLVVIVPLRFYDALVKFKDAIRGFINFSRFSDIEPKKPFMKSQRYAK